MMNDEGGGIASASYEVRQEFRYDYPGPIRNLRHRLIVAPPERYGDQHRASHRLITAPELTIAWNHDGFGNLIATIAAPRIESAVCFRYEAVIRRTADDRAPVLDESALTDVRYLQPSRLTLPSDALRTAARALQESDGNQTLTERINAFVAAHMRYVPDVTSVATSAAEAFELGEGVCQDYAHIMLALCRLCNIPARYVSGHLLGEGGTHAWIETIEAGPNGVVAQGFDPTHARRTTLRYVFVAAGRDYADVAPTSGSFSAPYMGVFSTTRNVDVLDVRYAA